MFETDTTQFEFSHGRKPRGTGQWAFKITVSRGNAYRTIEQWASGPYGEAKKLAVARARSEEPGCTIEIVEVLP